jgi:hypothetical protein
MYWDQSQKKRLTRSTAQETKNSRFAEDSCLHCSTGYLDNIARAAASVVHAKVKPTDGL